MVEFRDDVRRLHDTYRVIEDHHAARATHGAGFLQGVKIAVHLHCLVGRQDRQQEEAAGNDGFQRTALVQATGVLEDNIA